jgi:hypothetical protein
MGFGGLILPIATAFAIAIAVGCPTEINGFSPPISPFRKQHQDRARFGSIVPPPSALHARVYCPDGSVVGDDVFDNPDNGAKPVDEDLLESLKASVGDPSVWNMIACAFAPPPHNTLTPEVVRDAVPVGFSDSSIDIAVAVPASMEMGAANASANQLVRVLVKVGFPQAWAIPQDSTNDETIFALVGQIRILEGFARDRLSQRRTSSSGASPHDPGYYEKMVIEQRWQERLEEEPPVSGSDLPEWWTAIAPPFASLELMDEAKLLKKLLNEDEFEDDLRAVFVEHSESSKISHPLVLRVAVASIGSSGLFLRARLAAATVEPVAAAAASSSEDGNDDSEAEIVAITAVPYSNPPRETKTAGELREGVLLLIESVDPMPMPVRPQATAVSEESEADTITPFNEQVMEMFTELENETSTTLDGDTKDDKETTVTAKGEVDDVATPEADNSSSQAEDTLDGDTKDDEKETTGTAKGEVEDDVVTPEADDSSSQTEDTETSEESTSEKSSTSEKALGALSKQQPRPPDEEAKLAAKYAAIEDLGERAFAILRDLGMV